ncbi:MAG: VTC domain-containing protein [Proteobacteria bacterium]|nr:VTC domain-containing protein [Pseudomonadota bacterium]
MSFRIEDKLYIRPENLFQFYSFLNKNFIKKLYEPRIIKSLYFDNLKLEMYKDSIEGSVPRKKIRIREYPNSNDDKYYFEIKTSSVEGRFKTREIIDKEKNNFIVNFGYLDKDYGTCLPNFFVSYKREYFLFDNVRISIDTDINYINFLTNKIYKDNKAIVELKTSINKNSDDLAKMFPFQKIRFSKYCFAVYNVN